MAYAVKTYLCLINRVFNTQNYIFFKISVSSLFLKQNFLNFRLGTDNLQIILLLKINNNNFYSNNNNKKKKKKKWSRDKNIAVMECYYLSKPVEVIQKTALLGTAKILRKVVSLFLGTFCKISCLSASPRIFEHLKNGIHAHFLTDFYPKTSPRILGSLLSG